MILHMRVACSESVGSSFITRFEGQHSSGPLTEGLYNLDCLHRDCAHRLNTTAGSTRVTFIIAATADRAHIATVSMNRLSVRIGVMTTGTAAVAVACTMIQANIAAIKNPITALKRAWQSMTW